jgi:hypothetical protein
MGDGPSEGVAIIFCNLLILSILFVQTSAFLCSVAARNVLGFCYQNSYTFYTNLWNSFI